MTKGIAGVAFLWIIHGENGFQGDGESSQPACTLDLSAQDPSALLNNTWPTEHHDSEILWEVSQ